MCHSYTQSSIHRHHALSIVQVTPSGAEAMCHGNAVYTDIMHLVLYKSHQVELKLCAMAILNAVYTIHRHHALSIVQVP